MTTPAAQPEVVTIELSTDTIKFYRLVALQNALAGAIQRAHPRQQARTCWNQAHTAIRTMSLLVDLSHIRMEGDVPILDPVLGSKNST